MRLKFPTDSRKARKGIDVSQPAPTMLVRVSDGSTTQICQMPTEAATFLLRKRLCTVVGDVKARPDVVIDDTETDSIFAAGAGIA